MTSAWRLFFNALPLSSASSLIQIDGDAGARRTAAARAIGDRLIARMHNEPWRGGARLELIAFDGDDTLWHNERSFRAGRIDFNACSTMPACGSSEDEIDAVVNRVEIANIDYYGYGVSSFILSLIETAIDLTGGRVTGAAAARD